MSISSYVSIVPGSVGSFPQAGTRPKQYKYALYTSSGVWVCPPNVYEVMMWACGGGGGGGGGSNGSTIHGSGGGGAAAIVETKFVVIPNTTYTVTIGSGGTGGLVATGTNGGDTSFRGGVTNITLGGGKGGAASAGQPGAQGGLALQTLRTGSSYISEVTIVPKDYGYSLNYNPGSTGLMPLGGLSQVSSSAQLSAGGINPTTGGGGGGASLLGNGGNGGPSLTAGSSPTFGYGGGGGGGWGATSPDHRAGGAGAPGVLQLLWLEGL